MVSSSELIFKKVKVTDKGQVSIPVEVQRKVGIARGDELLLIVKGEKIVLERAGRIAELLEDEFSDLQATSEESLRRVWLNRSDNVWDKYLSEAID